MKAQLAALEVHYLAQELQTLVESRVNKIYQPDGFLFQFYKQGKLLLRIERNALWTTATKPATPQTPPGFCKILRKRLEGKKLTSLEQLDGERIVKMTFATLAETFHLYAELFSTGNLIVTTADDIIIAALDERAWKHRTIKKKEQYKTPPSKTNILTLQRGDFNFAITDTVSKYLAQLGFGKLYAHELCYRASIKPDAKRLTDDKRDSLYKAYTNILADTSGAHVYPDGEITPFKLAHKEDGQPFETFSQAIDSKFAQNAPEQQEEKINTVYLAKRDKIETKIRLQEESATKQEEEAAVNQRKGELVYEHYQELKDILTELNKALKTHPLHEVQLKLKGHPTIKDINPKTKDVTVELQD